MKLKINDIRENNREAVIKIYDIDDKDLEEIEIVIDRTAITSSFLVIQKYRKVFRESWQYKEPKKEEK